MFDKCKCNKISQRCPKCNRHINDVPVYQGNKL